MEDRKRILLRTMMFVPGHNDALIKKAVKSNADATVLDLEDSCKPDSNKLKGRNIIYDNIISGTFRETEIFVRINPRMTGFLFEDVSTLAIKGITGFLYPVATSKSDIIFFDNLLSEIELARNLPINYFSIFPVIESAEGVINAREICAASKRVVALGFGSEDFTTDQHSIRDEEGVSIFTPRALIAFAARSENVPPIDTPHINIHDLEGLEKHCRAARLLGYGGMQILHPKEIEIVHSVYTPTEQEVADAREMIMLSEKAEKDNKGVVVMNGKFIGPPLVKRAHKLIEEFELIDEKKPT